MKTRNQHGSSHVILVIVIVVAVLGALGYVFMAQLNKKAAPVAATQSIKRPGVVTSLAFAPSVDASGAPVSPTATFAPNTPTIAVALGLTGAKAAQRVEYTRYLNGKFVDNGAIPVKDGAKYASFSFTNKPGKERTKGVYTVKVYTNGVYERSSTYTVQ